MNQKERIKLELHSARKFSESLFESFKTPEHWMHQVEPRAYHPLWIAGHIALAENFSIQLLDPKRSFEKPLYREKFAVGTRPTRDLNDYPPLEEILEYMRERRATLLDILESLSDEDLEKPAPPGSPRFVPDVGSVFCGAAWHEAMHSGQVNVVYRALEEVPVGYKAPTWTGPSPVRGVVMD
jgi:DinB family protein